MVSSLPLGYCDKTRPILNRAGLGSVREATTLAGREQRIRPHSTNTRLKNAEPTSARPEVSEPS